MRFVFALILIAVLASPIVAQTSKSPGPITKSVPVSPPVPVPPPDPLPGLQSQLNTIAPQYEVLYNKLRDITEFQQYLQVRAQVDRLQSQIAAATEAKNKAAAPAAAPASSPK